MDREPSDFPDELLGRATGLLRRRLVPPGPSDAVAERLAAELTARQRSDTGNAFTTRRNFTMKSLIKLAVAAAVVVVISVVALRPGGRPQAAAFGDVLKAVGDVRSMQYKQVVTVTAPNQPPQTMTGQGLIDDAGRMRYTAEDGSVMILDPVKGKSLMLDDLHKLAFVGAVSDSPIAQMNIMDRFRHLNASAGKSIDARNIGGRMAPGFGAVGGDIRVWVDPDTRLPLLMEFGASRTGVQPDVLPNHQITFTDFVWNPDGAESLLSAEPPAGYRVAPAMKFDMTSPPTEQSLVVGLQGIANLNLGTFPAGLDMESLKSVMKHLGEAVAKQPQLREKFESIGPATMLNIGRLWMFVSDPANGLDWHYAGAGVALGQAGRPILWYKPAGQTDYHVIDADGRLHTVTAANLPAVPSRPLVLTSQGAVPATQP
jgi:hypothetical protein